MCAFTFSVFLSLFQLLPTAPFRILELGGSTVAAGLFLGLLTYASALSAPFTGALADRFGRRRMLLVASLVIAGLSTAYAFSKSWQLHPWIGPCVDREYRCGMGCWEPEPQRIL